MDRTPAPAPQPRSPPSIHRRIQEVQEPYESPIPFHLNPENPSAMRGPRDTPHRSGKGATRSLFFN